MHCSVRWMRATLVGLGVLAGACSKPPPPAPPPTTVLVAPVVAENLDLSTDAVATLDGFVDVDIRARVKGFLKTQDFADGAFVRKGQLLFTIDPSEYKAAVDKARGALGQARAAVSHAKVTVDRYRPLAAKQAVSQQELDNALAIQQASGAGAESARAALEEAQINLSYCTITSPVDGVAGTAQVRVGNLVGQSDPTLLTVVSQVDPMRVTFPASEMDYLRFAGRLAALEKLDPLDAGPERRVLELILADGSVYPHKGWFVSVNRAIASSTGTIGVQTFFPNPGRLLRPGQYGQIRIPRDDQGKNVLVVPQTAVKELQGAFTVGVVGPDDVVHIKTVTVGPRAGTRWAITDGLKAGERVITEGMVKVGEGMKVTPQADPSFTADAGK